ncbi:MAG: DUF1156 domain-containing protein [Candidatus Helarchaeota archaeon]
MYIENDFPIELNAIAKKESHSKKPIYQIHKYWARRLSSVFRMVIITTTNRNNLKEKQIWELFYKKHQKSNKIILDPFMGGGTTLIEANQLGFKTIGIDIQPLSWFIVKKELDPINLNTFDETFKDLEKEIGNKIKLLYSTKCSKCGSDADIMYAFWVKRIKCVNCQQIIPLYSSFRISSNKKNKIHSIMCPKCKTIFESQLIRTDLTCPNCKLSFDPLKGFYNNGAYICPYCGQKEKIIKNLKREKKLLQMEMFCIEFFCPYCRYKGLKKVEEYDLNKYEEAQNEFQRIRDKLKFPKQKILLGEKTRELLNHNYNFFYEMFNERQLLSLSLLLESILEIKNQNIKEYLLLIFSSILETNNLFCRYEPEYHKLKNMFSLHAYWPINMPIENNVWGTEFGRGTFVKYYEKVKKSKLYCLKPYERKIKNKKVEKIYISSKIQANYANSVDQLLNSEKNTIIKCQTSEDLSFINDNIIDFVITDPPYYDNVMYSELADFFYVWLRIGLKEKYTFFKPEYSPKAREIIVNKIQGKGEKEFIIGLVRVFKQCNRVLKENGLLIFTFHHKETKAWSSVLKAVLNSGFFIKSVFPIQSEMGGSDHIRDTKSIQYDAIIICKKKKEVEANISWQNLKDQIYLNAKKIISTLWKSGRTISDADLFVIAIGNCLELYSKNYPNIFCEGKVVEMEEAMDDIEEIVDSLIKSRDLDMLHQEIDELTRLFVLYISDKKEISFDELNKLLRTGGSDIDLFFKENLIIREGNVLKVALPEERKDFIENKLKKKVDFTYIDKIHYLYLLYEMNKPITKYLMEWGDVAIKEISDLLYKKTGDEIYKKIFGTIKVVPGKRKKVKKSTIKQLTEFIED